MMKIPFKPRTLEKSPAPRYGVENPYGTRALVHNWYEDRRQYHLDCGRCTGYSIYKTDYTPHHAEDYEKTACIPPKEYEMKRRQESEGGASMLMNTQDYCDYLKNYTTTYDLMYNWEVRRAGCKPKPWRKWMLVADALWMPQPDNSVSFGNLTQFGYRQAPQVPMVPNDWKTYDMSTTNKETYFKQKYPDAYTLCRVAPPKCVRREMEDLALVKLPPTCTCTNYYSAPCPRHLFDSPYPRVHPTLIPGHMLSSSKKEPAQTLFPTGNKTFDQLKHPPHPQPVPGEPILESVDPSGPCDTSAICSAAIRQINEENTLRAQCAIGKS